MISIITPYFNTDINLFDNLLKSISAQTDKDFEWIVVDDASKIPCENQVNKLKDVNVKIYRNNKNKGAGESRNVGIENAEGEYIVFVDSDDYIEKDFVKVINEAISVSRADAIFFDYSRIAKEKKTICKTISGNKYGTLEKDYVLINITSNVCGKVFATNVIRKSGIRFPNLKRYEDWTFGTTAIVNCKSFYYVNRTLYNVAENIFSVTKNESKTVPFAIKAFDLIQNLSIPFEIMELLFIREVLYSAIKDYGDKNVEEIDRQIHQYINIFPNWCRNKYYKLLNLRVRLFTTLYRYRILLPIKIVLKLYSR